MEGPKTLMEFLVHNWIQMGVLGMGVVGLIIGTQGRKDKHGIDKATKFNIDVDTLNDSFDLSQKLLKSLRTQLDGTQSLLDDTQTLLDKANTAYKMLEIEFFKVKIELQKAKEDNLKAKLKISNLNAENKELQMKINSCEFDCKFKKDVKTQNN